MKNSVAFLLLLLVNSFYAQRIQGVVQTENGSPLSEVNVYLDGTRISVKTNPDGQFSLDLGGQTEATVVFQKDHYDMHTAAAKNLLGKTVKVQLMPLQEIESVEIIPFTEEAYRQNIGYFLAQFVGEDQENVKIRNQRSLKFSYDRKNQFLKVKAPKTLVIENRRLGYQIHYHLMNFQADLRAHTISYYGTSFFTVISNKPQIKINRLNAYNGSLQHFMRSVFARKTASEGFIVNEIRKLDNPKYPSEEELQRFRDFWDLNRNAKNITVPEEISDISKRKNQGKYILALTRSKLQEADYTIRENGKVFLNWPYILQVNYPKKFSELKHRKAVQTGAPVNLSSMIYIEGNRFQIYPDGNTSDPDLLMVDGDFGNNKIDILLPSDYQPGD